MIRRVYPTLEAAVEVLRSSGYAPVVGNARVWMHTTAEDTVTVEPVNYEFPIRTRVA